MPGYNFRQLILFLLILLFGLQEGAGQKLHGKRHLRKQLKHFVKDSLLQGASIGIHVYDLRKAKSILEYDPDRALIPSSTQKLITSALLLDTLDPNYYFETKFYLDGELKDSGRFEGNIRVLGSGDPSFCSPYTDEAFSFNALADTLAELLKAKGVSKLYGDIEADQKYIQDIPENPEWLWYDVGNYYGAGCYSLNFMENEIQLILASSLAKDGICPIIAIRPDFYKDLFYSNVIGKDSFTKDDVFVLGSSLYEKRPLSGYWKCCSSDSLQIRASMPDPASCFSAMMRKSLVDRDLELVEHNHSVVQSKVPFYICHSPSVESLVRRNLKKSVNLYSESFLHLLGQNWNGSTRREYILKSINEYLRNAITSRRSFTMVDGSGLSRKNQMSSRDMTRFLSWICNKPKLKSFWNLIPDVYTSSLMQPYLLPKADPRYNLHLKSGSMERIRGYAGYLVIDQQPAIAIDIMINNYSCSSLDLTKRISMFLSEVVNTRY